MDVSPEHLVGQARERFQLHDYYGAIHLLEEVLASGRAFADAHHLLGLSYSLAGQNDKALAQFDQALELNPNYIEALIHRAIVLNELGREEARRGLACFVAGAGLSARAVWGECRERPPEDPRVEAYLAMLGRSDVPPSTPPLPSPPAASARAPRGGKRKKT